MIINETACTLATLIIATPLGRRGTPQSETTPAQVSFERFISSHCSTHSFIHSFIASHLIDHHSFVN